MWPSAATGRTTRTRPGCLVTRDLGKTWEDISGGLMNPLFDLEEDPDNANVLYIAGDFGIYVTIDQGKTWTNLLDHGPQCHRPRPGHPEARPRPGHRHLRPRASTSPTSARSRSSSPRSSRRTPISSTSKNVIRWNRFEQKGRDLRRIRQGRQPAGRRDDLLLSESRGQDRQADRSRTSKGP